MRKIGLYPRISIEEPELKKKDGSISSQIHRLTEKVEEKNRAHEDGKWGKIIDIYKDDGFSGKDTNRPEFQRMINDVRRGRIDTIMVTELSRISRSVADFLKICNELNQHGCDFICLQIEGFDTTTPIGKFIITIMIALYQLEREMTSERISNNNFVRGKKGLAPSGHPFLGFNRDSENKTYIPVDKEVDLVRKVFDLYLDEGLKIQQVAKRLNESGDVNKKWTTKKGEVRGGQPFDHSAIHRILNTWAYVGIREVNKNNKDKDQSKLKENKRYFQSPGNWEGIIEKDRFIRAQDKLALNKKMTKPAHHDFILSGVLYCGECGRSLFGASPRGRTQMYHYYEHKKKGSCAVHRWGANELEAMVKKQFFKLLNNESMREGFISAVKSLNKQASSSKSRLAEIDRQIKNLVGQKNHMVEVISRPGLESLDSLLDKLKDIEAEIARLEERKAEVEVMAFKETGNVVDAKFIFEQIKLFRGDGFRKKNVNFKREILQSLIKSVVIHPDNVLKIEVFANEGQDKGQKLKPSEAMDNMASFEDFGGPLGSPGSEKVVSIEGRKAFHLTSDPKVPYPRVGSDAIVVGARERT